MGMYASSQFYSSGLRFISSQVKHLVVMKSSAASASSAWQYAPTGAAMARSSSAIHFGTLGSTTSGYTIKSTQISSITVGGSSGNATHVALMGSSSSLHYITTCNSKALTTSDTVTIPAFNIRIAGPTSS